MDGMINKINNKRQITEENKKTISHYIKFLKYTLRLKKNLFFS